jgi:hypothetical protein
VDVDANQIVVRGGKGDRDRVTMLPAIVKADLVVAASRRSAPSTRTISRPRGWVELPTALVRKNRMRGGSGPGNGSSLLMHPP